MTSIDQLMADLRHAVASTTSVLARARAAAPEETTASDPAGAVAVSVDRHGAPVGIRVADDWSRRVDAPGLGAAVLAAAGAAQAALGRVMTAALHEDEDPDAPAPPAPSAVLPEFIGTPRPLADLAEIALSDLHRSADAPPDVPEAVSGAAGGPVTVSLVPGGLVDCRVDARWAAGRSGIALSMALDDALGAATRALHAQARPSSEQDTVLAEVFAHLRALTPATTDGEARA